MFIRRIGVVLSVVCATWMIISWAPAADACTLMGHSILEPLEEEPPEQTGPPPKPVVSVASITRGTSGHGDGGCGGHTYHSSCDEFGNIVFETEEADQELGYEFQITDGRTPDGFGFPSGPVQPRGPNVDVTYFHWTDERTDDQESFDFEVVVVAVDRWGRRSEPSKPVRVWHTGSSESACSTVSSASPWSSLTPIGLLLVVGAAARLRRRLAR